MEAQTRARLESIAWRRMAGMAPGHDVEHARRVVALVRRLLESHPEADADVVEAAAWLHDTGFRGRRAGKHAILSARIAAEELPALGFTKKQVALACTIIEQHSYSKHFEATTIEGQLIQDADRLDAMGAIGIARVFSDVKERRIYGPEDPFAVSRDLDDVRYSLDHFLIKILRLADYLHTKEAKALAEPRVKTIRAFMKALAEELGYPPDAAFRKGSGSKPLSA